MCAPVFCLSIPFSPAPVENPVRRRRRSIFPYCHPHRPLHPIPQKRKTPGRSGSRRSRQGVFFGWCSIPAGAATKSRSAYSRAPLSAIFSRVCFLICSRRADKYAENSTLSFA